MCLYPIMLRNPKYLPNKKNKGSPDKPNDERLLWVPVGCGRCEQCMKQRADSWRVRLMEEIKTNKSGVFVTLTFNTDNLDKLTDEAIKNIKSTEKQKVDDEIARLAVRRFLERWRRKNKKSVKHWLITELGHEGTERLHMHGIIFTDKKEEIEERWGYGWVYLGQYVNDKTINYIIKYCTKRDKDHPEWRGKIYCSAGIGANYKHTNKKHEYYRDSKGNIHALPHYYKNKAYTEDEREKLWLEKIEENAGYAGGRKYNLNDEWEFQQYWEETQIAINESERKGYKGRRKGD